MPLDLPDAIGRTRARVQDLQERLAREPSSIPIPAEMREQIVERVVERILEAWDSPDANLPESLKAEILDRLATRVLDRLS